MMIFTADEQLTFSVTKIRQTRGANTIAFEPRDKIGGAVCGEQKGAIPGNVELILQKTTAVFCKSLRYFI